MVAASGLAPTSPGMSEEVAGSRLLFPISDENYNENYQFDQMLTIQLSSRDEYSVKIESFMGNNPNSLEIYAIFLNEITERDTIIST